MPHANLTLLDPIFATATVTINHGFSLPIGDHYLRGLGPTCWFGCYENKTIEQLAEAWLLSPDAAERARLPGRIQQEAFQTVPSVPLGQFQLHNGYRKNLTGVVEAFGALFWNIQRA